MALIQSACGPHYLSFDDVKHKYTLDGERVPGATTFGKGGYPTSEQLISWMKGQAAQSAYDQLIEASTHEGNFIMWPDDDERKEIIKAAKQADKTKAAEAAAIGSAVHDFAFYTELGENAKALQSLQQFVGTSDWEKVNNGVTKFKEWKDQNNDKIIATEAIVASVEEQYGGKFDRLAERPKIGLVLSDFKTSSGIFVDQFIQLGAYTKAIEEWMGLKINAIEILRFGKEDGEFQTLLIKKPDEIQQLIDQAVLCRRTYRFRLKWEADKRFKWMGRA